MPQQELDLLQIAAALPAELGAGSPQVVGSDAYSTSLSSRYLYMREQEISSYFQDNYHITETLIANIGGRWEVLPAIHERDNQFTSFDYANAEVVTGLSTDQLVAKGYTTKQLVNGLQSIGVKFETPDQAGIAKWSYRK